MHEGGQMVGLCFHTICSNATYLVNAFRTVIPQSPEQKDILLSGLMVSSSPMSLMIDRNKISPISIGKSTLIKVTSCLTYPSAGKGVSRTSLHHR